MNKCRLCQQIYNNLTTVHNNRLKSLTQIVLKLKGFKDFWDINTDITLCEKCIKGAENVALFWEKIPEAKKETAGISGKLKEEIATAAYRMEQNIPALTLKPAEEKLEPIKLRIKLPPKRKNTENTTITIESLPKRTRRCPQRYEDFELASNNTTSSLKEENSKLMLDSDAGSALISFNDLPQVALLRLVDNDSQNIGVLAEVESKGLACKLRILCQNCGQVFGFEKAFQEHLLEAHYPTADNLKNYLYHCKLCDKPFPNHKAVRRHFKFLHSEERHFKCFHCEASFKYKFNLDYHTSTKHVPKKQFECTFCGKLFLMRYELQIHVRTHTKERPYKCEYCSFASAHKSNLKAHQKSIHLENSTKTQKSTPTTQFMPPKELIENEEELLAEINKNETVLQDTVNFKEKHTETALDEENILNCDQTNPLEALKEQKTSPSQHDLNNSDSEILTHFERFVENLESYETTASETMFETESSVEQPHLEDNKISRIMAPTHNYEGPLKPQSLLGVFQLDSSLLKVLPSSSLLGLKKWPKSFQNAQEPQLQLVKSSIFSSNKHMGEFEVNKTLIKDFKETNKNSTTDFANSFMNYKTTSFEINAASKSNSSILTQASSKTFASNETSATNKPVVTTASRNSNENLKPNINNSLKPFKSSSATASQSLLKPIVKETQTTSTAFSTTSLKQTLLSNKPLITNIEILPPLKILTTLQNSPPTTSLVKLPNEYKFQCPYCYKYFKQKSPLTKHLRTHTNEKPYKCNLCPKSYADASNYKKHKILHKNAAEALNISGRTTAYAVHASPAYSTVSDPDPDGIEVMQTLKKFECPTTDNDEDDIDDNCSDYSNIETQRWQDALDQALNTEIMRTNLIGINNANLPKSMQHVINTIDVRNTFSTEDPD